MVFQKYFGIDFVYGKHTLTFTFVAKQLQHIFKTSCNEKTPPNHKNAHHYHHHQQMSICSMCHINFWGLSIDETQLCILNELC